METFTRQEEADLHCSERRHLQKKRSIDWTTNSRSIKSHENLPTDNLIPVQYARRDLTISSLAQTGRRRCQKSHLKPLLFQLTHGSKVRSTKNHRITGATDWRRDSYCCSSACRPETCMWNGFSRGFRGCFGHLQHCSKMRAALGERTLYRKT